MTGGVAEHFVYQRIHTLGGKAFHLAEHLRIASRAFEHIYGYMPGLEERAIASMIADTLRLARVGSRTGAVVMLCFMPTEENNFGISCEFERRLLEAGYAHSALRPRAVTYEYSIPFPAFPTGFQLSAQALFDTSILWLSVRTARRVPSGAKGNRCFRAATHRFSGFGEGCFSLRRSPRGR